MIVANDVTVAGAGFNCDTNVVKFLFPNGEVKNLEKMSKLEVAQALLNEVKAARNKYIVIFNLIVYNDACNLIWTHQEIVEGMAR